jgi:hypothetical protein
VRKFNVSLNKYGRVQEDGTFEADLRLVQRLVKTKPMDQVVHYFYLRGPKLNLAQKTQQRIGGASPLPARTNSPMAPRTSSPAPSSAPSTAM